MGHEKRRSTRYHVSIDIKLIRDGVTSTALMMNLSKGGALVQGPFDPPMTVGERLEVSFRLPDQVRPLTTDAQIRWVSGSDSDSDSGSVGMQFMTDFQPSQTWALNRFLERQQPT